MKLDRTFLVLCLGALLLSEAALAAYPLEPVGAHDDGHQAEDAKESETELFAHSGPEADKVRELQMEAAEHDPAHANDDAHDAHDAHDDKAHSTADDAHATEGDDAHAADDGHGHDAEATDDGHHAAATHDAGDDSGTHKSSLHHGDPLAEHAAAEAHGHGHAGHGDFKSNIQAIGIVIGGLILLSLLVEVITEHLEEIVARVHLEEMLIKLYKELMILGLCSILLFMETHFHYLDAFFPNGFDLHLFEEVHMALFLILITYIVLVNVVLIWTLVNARSLQKMEQEWTLDSVTQKQQQLDAERAAMNPLILLFSCRWKYRAEKVRLAYDFHRLRHLFIQHQGLPENFAFATYLRKASRQTSIHLASVHWHVWFVALLFVFLSTVRSVAMDQDIMTVDWTLAGLLATCSLLTLYLYISHFSIVHVITNKYDLFAPPRTADAESAEDDDEDESDGEEELNLFGSGHEEHNLSHSPPRKWYQFKVPTEQERLFFLNRPSAVIKTLQFSLLVVAISLPTYFVYWIGDEPADDGLLQLLFTLLVIVPAFVIMFFALPNVMPRFIIATSVANMVRPKLLKDTLRKMRKEAKKGGKKEP